MEEINIYCNYSSINSKEDLRLRSTLRGLGYRCFFGVFPKMLQGGSVVVLRGSFQVT